MENIDTLCEKLKLRNCHKKKLNPKGTIHSCNKQILRYYVLTILNLL